MCPDDGYDGEEYLNAGRTILHTHWKNKRQGRCGGSYDYHIVLDFDHFSRVWHGPREGTHHFSNKSFALQAMPLTQIFC
jgi:hypothetical protein